MILKLQEALGNLQELKSTLIEMRESLWPRCTEKFFVSTWNEDAGAWLLGEYCKGSRDHSRG